jgi:hypothetical protein
LLKVLLLAAKDVYDRKESDKESAKAAADLCEKESYGKNKRN